MPAACARSRAGADSTFETTTPTCPPSDPPFAASTRAWRLVPRPLTSTPIFFMDAARASLEHDAASAHQGADHEARLAAPLQRVLDLVQVLGTHDHHHADA